LFKGSALVSGSRAEKNEPGAVASGLGVAGVVFLGWRLSGSFAELL